MMKRGVTYYITTGLLLGALLHGALLSAQAQIPVYDPAAHATQIQEAIKDAAKWVQTVEKYAKDLEQYARMYEQAVQQLTTMKGVLRVSEEQLIKHKALIGLVNDVGTIVRGTFTLKVHLERLVMHRVRALQNIDRRLRNGIFDPEADMRDFDEFLRHTIGRSAHDTLQRRARVVGSDAQLASWMDEKQKLEMEIATTYEMLKAAEAQLKAEMNTPVAARRDTTALVLTINNLSVRLAALEARHVALMEQITKRFVQHEMRIIDMEEFGFQVIAVNDAWEKLNETHDNLARIIDELVSGQ